MEKKRSIGVTLISSLVLVIGIIGTFNVLRDMSQFSEYNSDYWFMLVIFCSLIIVSIGLFKLLPWARITAIILSFICIGFYIYLIISFLNPRFFGHDYSGFELIGIIFYIPGVLLSLFFIYYFTRTKVKEQFK